MHIISKAQIEQNIAALKNAKEAIVTSLHHGADKAQAALDISDINETITMLKGLPAPPVQQPVAWITEHPRADPKRQVSFEPDDETVSCFGDKSTNTPLYLKPPTAFVPITADDVTDEMVNEYLTFMGKASYLRHPDVPYLGTAKNDSPEEWKLRFSKAAFAAAVNAFVPSYMGANK